MAGPMRKGPMGPKPKIEHPFRLLKRLLKFVFARYGFQYIIVLLCILLSVLCNLQGTKFTQTFIDDYITPMLHTATPDYGPLLGAMARVAVFYGLGVLCTFVYNKILVYIAQGTIKDMRDELFSHMQDLPIRYFDSHPHGDVMSVYTNDIDTLRQMVSQSIPQIFNSIITVIGVFVYMVSLSIPLTIVSIGMVVLITFISKSYMGRSSRHFVAQQKNLGQVNGFIEEMLTGQKVVKVFTHEQ